MAELINKKYNIELEVLTPLSIGAGSESDWARGIDFVVKNSKLYHLDLAKMVKCGIDVNLLTTYYANKDEKSVLQILGNRLETVSDKIMEMPCSSNNDIKIMLRNQFSGNPLIAGSSIKGAIRSVLFSLFRDDEDSDKAVFGDIKNGSDFMRFLRISDVEFSNTKLVNTKIYNLFGFGDDWQGGWKHAFTRTDMNFNPIGFNTIYECLMPHEKAPGSIMLAEKLFNNLVHSNIPQPHLDKKKDLFSYVDGYSPIENLFYEINNHTFDYLGKEEHFFKEYSQGENADLILNCIRQLQNQVYNCKESGNSCILKMAAGTGFHAITGDWQFDDYTDTGYTNKGKKMYKSRKIAIHDNKFSLMGFVKITIKQ